MTIPQPHRVRVPRHRRYHRWRRILQVATSVTIVLAPFLGLLRIDVPGRSLVLFRVHFSLQELAPIFGLLMLGMLMIFAGALIYGRLWCGWACPQTVLSELASALERRVVGGRRDDLARRALAAALQVGIAAGVSASAVSYLLDPRQYLAPPPAAWLGWGLLTLLLAADLVLLRHRFCVGICPYGVLQGVVQDARTLRVEMDPARGSECVGCQACVRACFMGVDVRQASGDLACLGCGDCIDAAIGSKRCPRGLLRFHFPRDGSSWPSWLVELGISDSKRALVAATLPVLGLGLAAMLATRSPLELRFSPRYEEARLDRLGVVHNLYTVTLTSRFDEPVRVRFHLSGIDGLQVESPGEVVELDAREHRRFDMVLRAPRGDLSGGAHPVAVRVVAGDYSTRDAHTASFFVPNGVRQ